MSKKKKKKKSFKDQLKIDLIGLLLIFLAIFGSGASAISGGIIPNTLEHIFRFIFGVWYFVASIALLVTGIILIVKKRLPNYKDKRFIGIYFIFTGILLFTHIQVFESLLVESNQSIIRLTWEGFLQYVNDSSSSGQLGGGFIGAILFVFFYYLFSSIGAKIISVFSVLVGILFLTNISLQKIFLFFGDKSKKVYQFLRKKLKERKERQKEVTVEEYYQTEEEAEVEEFTEITYANDFEQSEETSQEEMGEEVNVVDLPTTKLSDYEAENEDYQLPSPDLLDEVKGNVQKQNKSLIQATVRKLEKTFESFGVQARVVKVHVGPAVTKYEVNPASGVKVSRIVNLHDDLALALAAQDIRIEAPIPGKSAVGIEVPNDDVSMVSLREVLDSSMHHSSKLMFALGRDISGDAVVGDLEKMPHLLIAGATGSGKSVCINSIITTILMRAKPHEVKMMMIDPKKVELNVYNGIPHLLTPVVTDPKKAAQALKKVVAEMERRYELFSESGTRNIRAYNDYVHQYNQTAEEKIAHLPQIVVIVDELSDLMMVASKDVEDAITRLAQMARAAGIHLIIATQRPSVDVITGVIKANIPSRIAFSVSSQVDSRTILDVGGAEKLLGRGDMLYIPVGQSKPVRVQGAFLSDEEVERVVEHCKTQQEVVYQEEMIPETPSKAESEVDDELYDEAVQLVINMQTASVSMLQRRFRIGYNRAARLIDAMEERGVVGPYVGSRPRDVLIRIEETEEES